MKSSQIPMTNKRWWIVGLVGVLILCCCGLILLGTAQRMVANIMGWTPTPTSTARPTHTLIPTPPIPTITSTAIPLPPTDTPTLPAPTATPAPTSTPAGQCPGGCWEHLPGCDIKGNISSSGEKIYHVPGQRDYGKTKISPEKGERWFCTEEEARAAGWRKAQR